jgi:hypothetical protein
MAKIDYALQNEILGLPDSDVLICDRIQHKVVAQLDRQEKLTDKEELLVHIAIIKAYKLLKKELKK